MTENVKLRLNNFGRFNLSKFVLEALMSVFVVHCVWAFSGSILRTSNYDQDPHTAVYKLISTSIKGNVRMSRVEGDQRAGVEMQWEHSVH